MNLTMTYTLVVENAPKPLQSERARYQQTLATPAGSADVSFLVERQKNGEYVASCVVSKQAATKNYSDLKTDAPVDGQSNVSYRMAQQFADGSTREVSMMGFPIAEARFSRIGEDTLSTKVADLDIDHASNYMMVPETKGVMLANMLAGQGGVDTAASHTKLVEATYRGGEDVSDVFAKCVNDYMGNPQKVNAAIAKATTNFDFSYETVANAPQQLKSDLIGSTRNEFAEILETVNPADVAVVQVTEVKGGVLATLDGLEFKNPKNDHTFVTAGCYAFKEFDENGNLHRIGASHTVLESQEKSACLGNSENESTVTKTTFGPDMISTTTPAAYAAAQIVAVSSGGSSFGGGFIGGGSSSSHGGNNYYNHVGDTIINKDITKVIKEGDTIIDKDTTIICSNVGKFEGSFTDSFNNCNKDKDVVIVTPPQPAPVPLPGGLPLLAAGVGAFAIMRRKQVMKNILG